MSRLSEHFDSSEFNCKCGCGKGEQTSSILIDYLEKLFNLMDAKAIIVNSGYRCPTYSVRVGGSSTDAHTKHIAADIKVKKQDGSWYSSDEIAEAAERIGFGGIGVMNTACHVDIRHLGGFSNNHWFGDERNGKKVSSFQKGTVFPGEIKNDPIMPNLEKKNHTIQLFIDGIEILNKTIVD